MNTLKDVAITLKSGNTKTGPITVTGRARRTCPLSCTFNPLNPEGVGGCYTNGRIDAHYDRSSRDWSEVELKDHLSMSKSDRLRDRVDGDLLTEGELDRDYLHMLTSAALTTGFRWIWGYTHVQEVTPDDIPAGYVMNRSCETESDVQHAVDLGMPAVISSHVVKHGDIVAGRRVIQCPATRSDDIDCSTCGGSAGPICARENRETVVLFPLHGSGAKKAAESIERRTR